MTLERLGQSTAFCDQLLEILEAAGWATAVTPAFGGGVLAIAERAGLEVKAVGARDVDAVPVLFEEAARLSGPLGSVQLRLVAAA